MAAKQEHLIDVLLDLQHDLGKHLALPVRMLPAGATQTQLKQGLARALQATRTTSDGRPLAARLIWRDGLAEGGEGLRALGAFCSLEAAVERALSWELVLEQGVAERRLERVAIEDDFLAVTEALRRAIAEVRDGE